MERQFSKLPYAYNVTAALLLMVCSGPALAFDPPSSFTYQGKVYQSDGVSPLQDASVVFKMQILSPDGTCLLFEETYARDMTASDGFFTLQVGQGLNTGATTLTLPQVFNNALPMTGSAGCTYTPVSGDTRTLNLSYNDNGQIVTLATTQSTLSVPYALESMALEGLGKNSFIQVSPNTTQVNLDTLMANRSSLIALANGTSPLYAQASALPISGGILNLSSGGVLVPDVPPAAGDAVNKNYSDANLGGKTLNLTGLANGQALVWNSAVSSWQASTLASGTVTAVTAGAGLTGGSITSSGTIGLASVGTAGAYTKVTTDSYGRVTAGSNLAASDIATALGYTPLNKAGDTMAGDLNLGTHNLVNSGYITMNQGTYLGLGSYSTAGEATLISGTLTAGGASYAGVTWFNSTTNTVKFWNGSQAVTLTSSAGGAMQSLNSQSGTSQSLAVGAAGTAPGWSSASNVHTLNIPLAATSGTTAGLLSNADFAAFSAKGTVSSVSVTAPLTVSNASSTPAIALQTGTSAGQSLVWSGSAWGAGFANISQLRSSVTATSAQFPTNCTSAQTLVYQTPTDTYSCATIAVSVSQISGLGGAAVLNVGTTAGTVAAGNDSRLAGSVQSSASASGDLSGTFGSPTVAKLQGVAVSAAAPSSGQVLTYNSVNSTWQPVTPATFSLPNTGTAGTYSKVTTDAQGRVTSGSALASADVTTALGFTPGAGTVTSIAAGTGLTGGTVTSTGTLAVNVGTGASQVVQLDGNAKLPAVDGSQLTNIAMPPFSNMQVLSSTGAQTWNVPAGVSKVYVQIWGAGGGGGGGTGAAIGGAGGGAGAYGAAFVSVTGGGTLSVTVGAGGAGGGTGAAGGAGGSTSFGALSAGGGSGGLNVSNATTPGGTSAAMINVSGGAGSAAGPLSVVSLGGMGGSAGGGGGAGGGGSSNATNPGAAGAAPGGGGGGGGNGTLTGGATGGAGGNGRIILWY